MSQEKHNEKARIPTAPSKMSQPQEIHLLNAAFPDGATE